MRQEMESMKDLSKAKDEINIVSHTQEARRPLTTERMRRHNFDISTFGSGGARDAENNADLRIKLDGATNDLKRLMEEREKLLEISNNLKSELSVLKIPQSHKQQLPKRLQTRRSRRLKNMKIKFSH